MKKREKASNKKKDDLEFYEREPGKYEWLYRDGYGKISVLPNVIGLLILPFLISCAVFETLGYIGFILVFLISDAYYLYLRKRAVKTVRDEYVKYKKLEKMYEKMTPEESRAYLLKKIEQLSK